MPKVVSDIKFRRTGWLHDVKAKLCTCALRNFKWFYWSQGTEAHAIHMHPYQWAFVTEQGEPFTVLWELQIVTVRLGYISDDRAAYDDFMLLVCQRQCDLDPFKRWERNKDADSKAKVTDFLRSDCSPHYPYKTYRELACEALRLARFIWQTQTRRPLEIDGTKRGKIEAGND